MIKTLPSICEALGLNYRTENVNELHLLTALLALMVEERAGKEAVLGPEKAQTELDANPAVMLHCGQCGQ